MVNVEGVELVCPGRCMISCYRHGESVWCRHGIIRLPSVDAVGGWRDHVDAVSTD